jgi:hypothetical protein
VRTVLAVTVLLAGVEASQQATIDAWIAQGAAND